MKTVLQISGMSCAHCVKFVKEALEAVAGVQSADVSLEKNTATVEHADGVSPSALNEAVVEAGYEIM